MTDAIRNPTPLDYARPLPRRRMFPVRWVLDSSIAAAILILLVALVLPALNTRTMSPPRVRCASNMRQIGQALEIWASEHGGRFPDQLSDLLEEDLTASVFTCPSTKDTPASGATTRAIANNLTVGGHLSYIYLGKGLTIHATPDTVLLYEPITNHQNRGMNVLFADGHVDFLQPKDVQPLLRQVANHVTPVRLP